jgi:hypothetical protein
MQMSEVQQLTNGLYRVYWKDGGDSLAAVGSDSRGKHWLAPTNWLVSKDTDLIDYNKTWRLVEKVELIQASRY